MSLCSPFFILYFQQEKARAAEEEVREASVHVEELKNRYANPTIMIDRTINQCTKCHLREGHKRTKCPNGECQGPENCNDIEKHPAEKKLLHGAISNLKCKQKENQLVQDELQSRVNSVSSMKCSFKFQIESALINTNLDKYTFHSSNGRVVRQTIINNDIHILQQIYKNKIPTKMESESNNFQRLIEDYNTRYLPVSGKKTINPVVSKMEDVGIKYPQSIEDEESQIATAIRESAKDVLPPKKRRFYDF